MKKQKRLGGEEAKTLEKTGGFFGGRVRGRDIVTYKKNSNAIDAHHK